MTANPTPEPGQVWLDNDQRTMGAGEFSITAVVKKDGVYYARVKRHDSGKHTRIRVDRLAKTTGNRGYVYIGMSK